MRHSVAIVAIARNESQYINEWIEYHAALGFDHFYIYDNSFGSEERLSKSISEGNKPLVSIIPAYNKLAFQKQAYGIAYGKFSPYHDFLLFIDLDEFFTLGIHKTVSDYVDFLNGKCPGFQNARIHWEIYDDNDVLERDMSVPVHEFFTRLANTSDAIRHNNTTKSLVRTKIPGVYFPNVHFPKSRSVNTIVTCDSLGREVHPDNQFVHERDVSVAKIRHYVTKTISEYMYQKLCRGDADGYIVRNIWNRFFNYCIETPEKIEYYNQHKNDVYVGKYAGSSRMDAIGRSRRDKVVVAMTTWTKRLDSCMKVLESVLRQTMKPNALFLTLSLEEFPRREIDLPYGMVQLFKTHPEFKMNWVEGNDKSFKKLFPVLPYLDDNDIIMIIDDDFVLPDNTIYSRYRDFNMANRECVITSDWEDCGQTMMFQKKMLNGYEKFFIPEIVHTGNDDAVYFNIFHLNGYRTRKGSDVYFSNSKRIIFDGLGLTENHQYLPPPDVTVIMQKIIHSRFNGKWEDLFGVFRTGIVGDSSSSNGTSANSMERELESTFLNRVEKFFYGDNLRLVDGIKTPLFLGSDIPNQMGKDVLCCGLGWKYLPGQPHRKFRQFVPPTNFCYLRGEISRNQVIHDGVNLPRNVPVGDSRLLSSVVLSEIELNPIMDMGIVLGDRWVEPNDRYVKMARVKFPDHQVSAIRTTETGFEELVEFICQCRIVLTCSLWGVALAHAYGVPVVCFLESSGYEFMDYYSAFKDVRYGKLTRKIPFEDALEDARNKAFVEKVNPAREDVQAIQKGILLSLPYREHMVEGI